MQKSKWIILTLFLAMIIGCTGNLADRPRDPIASLKVDNRESDSMTIYVVKGGVKQRLGQVNGLSIKRFIIPSHLLRDSYRLQFLADPIGSAKTPISDVLKVSPGEEITLLILNSL